MNCVLVDWAFILASAKPPHAEEPHAQGPTGRLARFGWGDFLRREASSCSSRWSRTGASSVPKFSFPTVATAASSAPGALVTSAGALIESIFEFYCAAPTPAIEKTAPVDQRRTVDKAMPTLMNTRIRCRPHFRYHRDSIRDTDMRAVRFAA